MANAGMSGFVSFLDAPQLEAAGSRPPEEPAPPATAVSDTVAKLDTVVKTDTVATSDTVKEIVTVQERKSTTVQKPATVQQVSPVDESYTVSVQPFQESRRGKVKRARAVEDGHSLAEQEVYRTLWKVGAPEGDDPEANRTVRIGYDKLAGLVRLSWVTVKANLRSLEKKLAIEVVAAEDSANREGKQYRVYSNAAIWARRQTAGLLWVRRTRGVELLTDALGATSPGRTEQPRFPYRT